jgi:hypothetical protein
MALKTDPETGNMQRVGTDAHGGAPDADIKLLAEVFSGPDGERLRSEIAQDAARRGCFVPVLAVLQERKDRQTSWAVQELAKKEQLRRGRLAREKYSGAITEAEYQKQLREGTV